MKIINISSNKNICLQLEKINNYKFFLANLLINLTRSDLIKFFMIAK